MVERGFAAIWCAQRGFDVEVQAGLQAGLGSGLGGLDELVVGWSGVAGKAAGEQVRRQSQFGGFFWRCFWKFFRIPLKVTQVMCWVVWFGGFDDFFIFLEVMRADLMLLVCW